ncbi:hypothetical protein EDD86DRAFT_255264 [Gorgonomyces haynaldii]|nr:hypothetical protein EDD86DRAFT_255264 [Gorgonomyces haynaldii]
MEYTRLVSSQWLQNYYCDTPADVVYAFDMIDPLAFYPAENETWPAIVTMSGGPPSPVYGDYACGVLQVFPMDGECCLSSASRGLPVASGGGSGAYASGIVNYDFGLDSFPRQSNGHMYCSLNATTRLEPSPIDGNLFGWARIYYLAQSSKGSGVCIDDSVKCFDNGTLFVYPDLQCQGVPTAVQLSDAIQPFENDILGSVTGQMITPTTGDTHVFWIAMQPSWYYTSNPSSGFWQGLQLFNYVVGLLCFLFVLVWAILGVIHRRTATGFLLILLATLSTISICFSYIKSYIVIEDGRIANRIYTAAEYTSSLASLTSLMYTATFVCIMNELKKGHQILVYVSVFVIHIVLDGSTYFNFLWNMIDDESIANGFFNHTNLTNWGSLFKYYVLFDQLWNTLPGPMIFYKIAINRTNDLRRALVFIYKQDKLFYHVLLLRVFVIAMTYVVNYVADSTTWVRSDANTWSLMSLHRVIDSFLLLSQVYMLESVRRCMARPSTLELTNMDMKSSTHKSLQSSAATHTTT